MSLNQYAAQAQARARLALHRPWTVRVWMLRVWMVLLCLPVFALALSAALLLNAPPARASMMPLEGSVIANRASVTYFTQSAIEAQTVYSNTVEARVAALYALDLAPDQSVQLSPGATFRFVHMLENTGNAASGYTLRITPTGPTTPASIKVYLDNNQNGVVDGGDVEVILTLNAGVYTATLANLPPTYAHSLIVTGGVSTGAAGGQNISLAIEAATVPVAGGVAVVDSNTDTVWVVTGATLDASKTAAPAPSSGALSASSVVEYSLKVQNTSNTVAAGIATATLAKSYPLNINNVIEGPASGVQDYPVRIEGVAQTRVLLRDLIPVGMRYQTGSLASNTLGAQLLYRYAGEPPFQYRTNGSFPNVVEVAVALPQLAAGQTLDMRFKTTVEPGYTGSFDNTGETFFQGTTSDTSRNQQPQPSNTVTHLSTRGAAADLLVQKSHGGNFALGMEESFTIQVTNMAAHATTAPFTITDTFPAHMVYLGASGAGWTCPAASSPAAYVSTLTCSYQNTLAGMAATGSGSGSAVGQPAPPLTIKVRVDAAAIAAGEDTAELTNRVAVAGGGESLADTGNNSDEDIVTVERLGTVKGKVWLDLNHDRTFQNGEPTLSGWTAQLLLIGFKQRTTQANATSAVYAANAARAERKAQLAAANANSSGGATVRPLATEDLFEVPAGMVPVIVQVLPSNVTLADGLYTISGVRPRGNYALRFISPKGVVFSLPVDGEHGTEQSGALVSPDLGSLMVLNVDAGETVIEQSLPLSPTGVVYDAVTRQPVAEVKVRLIGPVGFDPEIHLVGGVDGLIVTTDATGYYQFRLTGTAPAGEYRLELTVPAPYAGLSTLIPPQPQALSTAAGSLTSLVVQPQSTAPAGTQATTYYTKFTWGGANNYVVNNHLPIERQNVTFEGELALSKTASKTQAEVVDFVDYTIEATNNTKTALYDIQINDTPAYGFSYLPGSAQWKLSDGAVVRTEPEMIKGTDGSYTMRFSRSQTSVLLAPKGKITLRYRMSVTPAALKGDGVNTAQAHSTLPGKISSTRAQATVKVVGGVFADEAIVLGKVFMDCNRSGLQDKDEVGIPGVRLFMQDGSFVITDGEGKYSIYGVKPMTHVFKVDMHTLPAGAEMGETSNRNSTVGLVNAENKASRAQTQFVDAKRGELHRADFALTSCTPEIAAEVATRRASAAKTMKTEAQTAVAATEAFKDQTRQAAQNASKGVSGSNGTNASASANTNTNSGASGNNKVPVAGMIDRETAKVRDQVAQPLVSVTKHSEPQAAAPEDKTKALVATEVPPAPEAGLPKLVVSTKINTVWELEDRLREESQNTLAFLNLKDGERIGTRQTRVQVRGKQGSTLELSVNGSVVPEARVGKRSKVSAKQIEAWEYIAVELSPGLNELQLVEIDSLGTERGKTRIKVWAAGELARIRLATAGDLVADGRTAGMVRVRLEDEHGTLIETRRTITLEGRGVAWAETDIDPHEAGVQMMLSGGEGLLSLLPQVQAGDFEVALRVDEVKQVQTLSFVPEMRPLIAVGSIEGTLRFSNSAIAGMEPVRETDPFERELTEFARTSGNNKQAVAARAAFFVKGKILGKYLLTAAYDSEKKTADKLFSDIQPEAYYPIYGDASVRGFDAQTSGKLFVRVDKERSYIMLGDFAAAPASVRQLTNFDRNLYGAKLQVNEAIGAPERNMRVVADAYAAKGTQRKITLDEVAGTGLTGPYRLPGFKDLLENSEIVEVVVRDRLRPSVVIKTTRLARFADYVLDAVTGELRLIAPLASIDEAGNRQYLKISYERRAGGEEFWTYGGSAQIEVSDKLTVGVAAAQNKDPAKPTLGAGVYAQGKIGGLTLSAEVASSEVKPAAGNTTAADNTVPSAAQGTKTGQAARVEAKYQEGAFNATASAVKATKGYVNIGTGATAGQLSSKLDISYALSSSTALTGQALYTKDDIARTTQTGYQAGVRQKLGSYVDLELGARHYNNETQPAAGSSAAATNDTGDTWIAKLAARAPFNPNLTGTLEWEQDVSKTTRRRLVAGANYKVGFGRFYAKHEIQSSLGNTYSLNSNSESKTSLFGFAVDYALSGSVYGEYRIPSAMDAKAAQAALGVKHKFALNPNWALSVQAERTQAVGSSPSDVAGGTKTAPERNTSISAAMEYTGDPNLRFMQRLEWRRSQSERQLNLLFAGAYHLSEDWSALGRVLKEIREQVSTTAAPDARYDLSRIQIGAAFRPVSWNAFNALAKLEFSRQKNTGGTAAASLTDATILSLHGNWQASSDLIVSARYAAKWARATAIGGTGENRNHAQLLYARVTYDLTDRIDLGLQAFGTWAKGGTTEKGLGLEIGYLIQANLWLSLGYNWMGFVASDLARDLQTTQGAYLRLRMKFDENGF